MTTRMKFKQVVPEVEESEEMKLAKWELWRMGDLSWKLLGCQNEMYEEFINQDRDVSVLLCARRTGKSFVNLIACIETCIQHEGIIIKYACPTKKMVEDIILPNLELIFKDAPPEFNVKEMWNSQKGIFSFPGTNSKMYIAGTDNGNAENLRGAFAHIIVCDEAGFMDDLGYVIGSILLPQTDTTGGKLVLTSTPNYYNPLHEFHTDYIYPAESGGYLIEFTLWDSPTTTYEEKLKIVSRYEKRGGINDPQFRCEYLVEIPKTAETNVVPEFSYNKENIIDDSMELPTFVNTYTSGDLGVRDLTHFLFGYYDFKNATYVILDEWVENGANVTSKRIAEAVHDKEREHFTHKNGRFNYPIKRVMDNDLKLINDLRMDYELSFTATEKKDKMAAISNVRVAIEEGRLKIHPRCKNLIHHVENARWKKTRTGKVREFDHLEEVKTVDGELLPRSHADGLDALIYFVRNVNENINPYPSEGYTYSDGTHVSATGLQRLESNKQTNILKKMFGLKR